MGNAGLGAAAPQGHPGCADAGGRVFKVQLVATPILEVAGIKAYHTSIVIGRVEYFFDADGIITAPALWSHTGIDGRSPSNKLDQAPPLGAANTEVIDMGVTPVTPEAFLRAMTPFFLTGTYDIILKNCNTFSDAALYFLTRTRLESRYARLERFLTMTRPLSTRLLSAALQSLQAEQSQTPVGYQMNPLAEHFNVEDIVGVCDNADMVRWGRLQGSSRLVACCSPQNPWGMVGCCQGCDVVNMETTTSTWCVEHSKEYGADAVDAPLALGHIDTDHITRAADLLQMHRVGEEAYLAPRTRGQRVER